MEQAAFLFSGVGGMLLTEMEISNIRNITLIARRLAWINAKRTHIDIPSFVSATTEPTAYRTLNSEF